MVDELFSIHRLFLEKLQARYILDPVALTHPFPERPWRSLGLIKIDGSVFSSERFLRAMVLTTTMLVSSRCTRSLFLSPRTELYLPAFSSETILMGSKRAFLVDIHTTVRPQRWQELNIEARMLAIKQRYADLCREPLVLRGRINDIMSRGSVYVRVPPGADGQALGIFTEYLDLYCELVDAARPCEPTEHIRSQEDFEWYYTTVMNHDPAVKLYSLLFGNDGGQARVRELFFAR
ncbi:MAG: hypothetical protein N3B18_11040 [Desulfobacterota bacterium]|nr:hypothetical protein [Thermodesulfobacteriota bacterium]